MKTQLINFTIPEKLLNELDSLAKKKERSRSSILREAARLITRRAKKRESDFARIKKSAKGVNLDEDEAIALIEKVRDKLQINEG